MHRQWLGSIVLAGALWSMGCSNSAAPMSTDAGHDTGTFDSTQPEDLGVFPIDAGIDAPLADLQIVDTGAELTTDDTAEDTVVVDVVADVPSTDLGADAAPADVTADAMVTDAAPTNPARPMTLPTNGSAVAISPDNTVAVMVNRTVNTVSVFTTSLGTTPPTVVRTAELPTGPSTQPWSVVIGNDGDTAYVVCRQGQRVLRINHLHTAPTLAAMTAATGSEPTGIAISPSGLQLYVANWAEGTVSVVSTATMTVTGNLDLNGPLAATGLLGTVGARPGLAHPRAIAVTNDGTGTDIGQTVYVTEFFSQARTSGVPVDDSRFDVGRQGIVYRFDAGTYAMAAPITLAPVTNSGFVDSDGVETGCFPNQLYAATVDATRLYVTAVCASPRGPVNVVTGSSANVANVKTEVHASIFVIDTVANAEIPAQGLRLPQQFASVFGAAGGRNPLIPIDLAFVPTSHVAYVAGYGSDAVYRVAYNADGTLQQVGSAAGNFIDVLSTPPTAGGLPYGIATDHTGSFALVANETTRSLSIVQIASQSVVTAIGSSGPPAVGPQTSVNNGRRFFVTGGGRWSLNGSSWNSCESCHPDGLSDGVTWYFARGPRQTISLDGTFDAAGDQRILNWTATLDEVHDFENNTRANSGGVGAVVALASSPPVSGDEIVFDGSSPVPPQVATLNRQDGLNGAVRSMMPESAGVTPATGTTPLRSVLSNWDDIETWIRQIRAPRAPNTLNAADVTAGQALFVANQCAGCHGGPLGTVSRLFYTPGEANNNLATGNLITQSWTRPAGFPTTVVGPSGTYRLSPFDPANDQISCALRNVGTFPPSTGSVDALGRLLGVAPSGVSFIEVRADASGALGSMHVGAQGATGFNPPVLLGLGASAPYLHGGNARTLEEVFSATFASHHAAYAPGFLATGDVTTPVRQLVAYLESIDDTTTMVATPAASTLGFNPDVCGLGSFP